MNLNKPNYINNLEDLKRVQDHPYRIGEYLTDETQIFEIDEDLDIVQGLIDSYEPDNLIYMVNWEDQNLYTEEGKQIQSVY